MNFDLNVQNYKHDELLEIFGLPKNYDSNILEICETKLRNNINNNKTITTETKNKTINFVVQAKKILLSNTNVNTIFQIPAETTINQENNKNKTIHKLEKQLGQIYHTTNQLEPVQLENTQEHMVQVRPEPPYVSSRPRDFFPGTINPIQVNSFRQFLTIDSRFRDNYYGSTSSNFFVNLPIILNKILTMELLSIEIPLTYYSISKKLGTNYFTLDVEGEEPIVVIVPDGNYSSSGIQTFLNDEMQKLGGNFQYITFTIDIDTNKNGTHKMIVNIDPNQNLKFSLNFQADILGAEDRNTPLPLKFGWKLGFRNGIYENNTTYISESVIDLVGHKYFYLVVNDYNNNVATSFNTSFNSSLLNNSNILARISVSSTTSLPELFDVCSQNNFKAITYPRTYFGPVTIKNMTIQLLDEYGRFMDLNNTDISFCLTLQTAYDI
jgi:hypothetical protein